MKILKNISKIALLFILFISIIFVTKSQARDKIYDIWDAVSYENNWFCIEAEQSFTKYTSGTWTKVNTISKTSDDGPAWHMLRLYSKF